LNIIVLVTTVERRLDHIKLEFGIVSSKVRGKIGLTTRRSTRTTKILATTKRITALMTRGCVQAKILPPRLIPRIRQVKAWSK